MMSCPKGNVTSFRLPVATPDKTLSTLPSLSTAKSGGQISEYSTPSTELLILRQPSTMLKIPSMLAVQAVTMTRWVVVGRIAFVGFGGSPWQPAKSQTRNKIILIQGLGKQDFWPMRIPPL
jgi:hypothetical protein